MKRSRFWYLAAGGLVFGAILVLALLAPYVTPVSPDYRDTTTSYLQKAPPFPPSARHVLGTDQFGRDVWSRVVYGARWSLLFAGLITAARLAVALPMGYAAARRRKSVGWIISRLYVLTGSIPPLVIYLFLLPNLSVRYLGLWPCFVVTAALLALVEWPRLAVFLQGRMETLLGEPFMEGAVAVGAGSGQIYRQHLRPHLWPVVLQAATQELGRALLVLGELGIFGIFAGGGIWETTNGIGNSMVTVSGVSEWGSMLADSRMYLLTAPWATFAPAVALFLAIAGANWLSQGLEGVAFPFTRWQQATTGRLSRWWRLAWVPVAVGAVLWYFQGVPWGRQAEVRAVLDGQLQALRAGDVAGYVQTIDPQNQDFVRERQAWAGTVTSDNWDKTVGVFAFQNVTGRRAFVIMRFPGVNSGGPGQIRVPTYRAIELERRWGRWYQTGTPLATIRGTHVTLETPYTMNDPARTGIEGRSAIISLSTSADRAYERVTALTDLGRPARPVLKVYETGLAFTANLAPATGATIWYVPGKAILVNGEEVKTWDRARLEPLLAVELLKAMSPPGKPVSPLALGLLTRQADGRPTYRADFRLLAGTTLPSLEEMFSIKPAELTPQQQNALAGGSALLIEFLGQWLDADRLQALIRSGASLAEVEAAAGVTLKEQYSDWLYRKLAEDSIMTVPAGQQLVPKALQAEAAAAGRLVLDIDQKKDSLVVYLLERDGGGRVRVIQMEWRPPAGT